MRGILAGDFFGGEAAVGGAAPGLGGLLPFCRALPVCLGFGEGEGGDGGGGNDGCEGSCGCAGDCVDVWTSDGGDVGVEDGGDGAETEGAAAFVATLIVAWDSAPAGWLTCCPACSCAVSRAAVWAGSWLSCCASGSWEVQRCLQPVL